jgi:hypothetical protein
MVSAPSSLRYLGHIRLDHDPYSPDTSGNDAANSLMNQVWYKK